MSVRLGLLTPRERRFLQARGVDPDAVEAAAVAAQAPPEVRQAYLAELADRVPLHPWRQVQESEDGGAWTNGKLNVIASVAREQDGRLWIHVSVSLRHRLPTYGDLCRVKDLFIGDRRTLHVFPKAAEHVNLAEVLHLWACWEEDGLPDFSRGVGAI